MNGKAGLNRKAAVMCHFPEGSQAEISVVYMFVATLVAQSVQIQ